MFIIKLIAAWIITYIIVVGLLAIAVSNPFSKPSLSNRTVLILSAIITTAFMIFVFWDTDANIFTPAEVRKSHPISTSFHQHTEIQKPYSSISFYVYPPTA